MSVEQINSFCIIPGKCKIALGEMGDQNSKVIRKTIIAIWFCLLYGVLLYLLSANNKIFQDFCFLFSKYSFLALCTFRILRVLFL